MSSSGAEIRGLHAKLPGRSHDICHGHSDCNLGIIQIIYTFWMQFLHSVLWFNPNIPTTTSGRKCLPAPHCVPDELHLTQRPAFRHFVPTTRRFSLVTGSENPKLSWQWRLCVGCSVSPCRWLTSRVYAWNLILRGCHCPAVKSFFSVPAAWLLLSTVISWL